MKERQSLATHKRFALSGWERYVITAADGRYMLIVEVSCTGHKETVMIAFADMKKNDVAHAMGFRRRFRHSTILSHVSTEDGYITWANPVLRAAFVVRGNKRHLLFACPSLKLPDGRVGLDVNIILLQGIYEKQNKDMSLRKASSNQRSCWMGTITGMPVSGTLRLGEDMEAFSPDSAWAALDWCRKKGRVRLKKSPVLNATGIHDGAACSISLAMTSRSGSGERHSFISYEGKTYNLSGIIWEAHEYDGLLNAEIHDDAGMLNIRFIPAFSNQTEPSRLFGRVSGRFCPSIGKEIWIESFSGFIEERRITGATTCID
ncbi:hypothetical protein Spico_0306 [Parasphaerochaeta coccoides DSM 17374]|uniref:Uncharacterized protein n=1 Tax=Parasphaerochaeta coccoides (strain ATCC BAA-1237 / DSM 17374 / SPN1) TaxID=760011 RepID=F4GH61_PARC1|nr:DUF2804 family protein [Parasphaerochaeta coccoides]AEC01536.1 hypothetical protein Spico_0306 [Parasphaerochaeta coccoides DSM 17374]